MPKNIVILSDGTGQKGGVDKNTNVYKIFNIIEDRTDDQIVFYDPGLGTAGTELLKQITGLGISQNIKDCYEFLFEHYQAGDQIFLIGFSRGAATVRSLSSLIHYFGILPKSRPDLIDDAYDIYKIENESRRKAQAKAFVNRNHTMWTRIKFLGCFDTVAALGFPVKVISALLDCIPFFRHKFHNFKLSKSVENARQALAIDEERRAFQPVLWHPKTHAHQTMQQLWFSGVHGDVGGGYKEHTLSDIPLLWMLKEAVDVGLKVYDEGRISVNPRATGTLHNSRAAWWEQLMYRKKVRSWPADRTDHPLVHQSVIDRAKACNYAPWVPQTNKP